MSFFEFGKEKLHYYSYEYCESPKAITLFFHGFNSHGGASGYFNIQAAKIAKINTYSLDFHNFGIHAGNKKGELTSFEHCIEQATEFSKFILKKFTTKPKVFLCGQSFGGSICFKMSLANPEAYAGIIFLSPALR